MQKSEADIEHNKIIWASRRGMLELDLVLEQFAKKQYPQLSEEEKRRYKALLECEDQELFDWFMKKKPVDDIHSKAIEMVLRYQAERDLY